MVKKLISVVVILLTSYSLQAQIAKWLIPPKYDVILFDKDGDVFIADSAKQKVLWSKFGRRLASTSDVLWNYNEGLAVTTREDNIVITGFYSRKGDFKQLKDCKVTYNQPYFYNNRLLVENGDYYRFVSTEGDICEGKYKIAYPFSNGYASCFTYENLQKERNGYNLLLTQDNSKVIFSYDDKTFDDDELDFISSINDEGVGIVVAKNKLYYFNGKNRKLSPLYAHEGENNLKNQVKVSGSRTSWLTQESDSVWVLNAQRNKHEKVQIWFNNLLVPISISLSEKKYEYKKNITQKQTSESSINVTSDGNKYGLNWNDIVVLPPQLEEVIKNYGDKSYVRLLNKCGIIQILKDKNFQISINKNNPIGFRHQNYETTIRVDLPQEISSYNAKLNVDANSGCEIDMPSCERKDTEYGNYIQYDCKLIIPDSLPDEIGKDERNDIIYNIQISYEDLISPIIPFKVQAWHYKYFNVNIEEADIKINSQGNLTFIFNLNVDREPGETVFPLEPAIITDSLEYELEKISETRYKCYVQSLKDGTNNIIIQIKENGCPPASFPFEATYTKKQKKAIIKKKSNPVTKQTRELKI